LKASQLLIAIIFLLIIGCSKNYEQTALNGSPKNNIKNSSFQGTHFDKRFKL